jgi:hypothetical protein
MISSYHDLTFPVFDLQLILKLSDYPPAFFHNAHNFLQGRLRLSTFIFGYISRIWSNNDRQIYDAKTKLTIEIDR